MNDNFESKFNSRSTPKKPQNNEIMDRKSLSIDVIYSELQSMKNEMNNALVSSNLKIEEKFKRYDSNIQHINSIHQISKGNIDEIQNRLTNIEVAIEDISQLKKNYQILKSQVDELATEVKIMKSIESESKNSYQDIISKLNENFNRINLSLEEKLGTINKAFNASFIESKNLINQFTDGTQINSISESALKINENSLILEKPVETDTHVKSLIDESKSSLFCKPTQTSQIIKDLKAKGDSTENENDKNSIFTTIPNPIFSIPQENSKSNDKSATINKSDDIPKNSLFGYKPTGEIQKSTEKTNVSVISDEGVKNTLFRSQANSEVPKLIFNNSNPSNLFSKNIPNKPESPVTQTGIFSSLKMTVPAVSNEPLFGTKLFGDSQDSNKPLTNLFASKPVDSTDNATTNIFTKSSATGSLFKSESNSKNPEAASNIFGANSNSQSFSFLSESKNVGFGDSTEASWKAGSKLFGKNKSVTEESQHDESVEEEHDPHFQPIIDLPPLVQLTNDEESYDILFKNRCKLYRFINNEWKERGVGDMKIMQSKQEFNGAKTVMLVMRREQIRKICCNQRVSKNSPIFAAMPNASNKSICWVATDYSEDEPKQEKFAIKFSSEDVLKEFQNVVIRVQEGLSNESTTN